MTFSSESEREQSRLAELLGLGLVDTAPSPSFDAITAAAVETFAVPISAISFVDEHRQWFKSAVGLGATTQTPRDVSFCAHVVSSQGYVEVCDATKDDRFAANPLVTDDPSIRFYAGAPITSKDGNTLGAVCVIDTVPRQLTNSQRSILEHLAAMAAALCEEHAHRRETMDNVEVVLDAIGDAVVATRADGAVTFLNPAASAITGWTPQEAVGTAFTDLLRFEEGNGHPIPCPITACLKTGTAPHLPTDVVLVIKDGTAIPVEESVAAIIDATGQQIGAAIVIRDVTEQRHLREELTFLADHDPLTGLFNRLAFERHAETAIDQARHEEVTHALLYLDLDRFKAVNDKYGHSVGDELLRRFSEVLLEAAGPKATAARLGGDEFGVLLRNHSAENAVIIGERITAGVRDVSSNFAALAIQTSVSIGVTELHAGSTSVADALRQADTACYSAKRAGGSQTQVFEIDTRETVTEPACIED